MGCLKFASLSSGSKANSFFISYNDTRVLVDCGLSAKEAASRLVSIGEDPDSITALVVTHEHSDHVKGVRVFSNRHKIPIYVNSGTYNYSGDALDVSSEKLNIFETGEPFKIGSLVFDPFSVSHDAADPVMFKISADSRSLSLVTDLGHVTALVRQQVRDSLAVVIESNHDPLLMEEAPYPWSVKQRIMGKRGHLSNQSAACLVEEIAALRLKPEILLAAHISENSNRSELAVEGFREAWARGSGGQEPVIEAIVADRVSTVFEL